MKDNDWSKISEYRVVTNALIPIDERGRDLVEQNVGRTLTFKEVTDRDIKYHRAYFALLNFVYSWLPKRFKDAVPEKHFYLWLKHLMGRYKVLYEFADGTKMMEYESISFGKMSQATFSEYVKNQLTVIYEDLIWKLCPDEAELIIENIEFEFDNFLNRL